MHAAFSEWRFSHNAFIFAPRTLCGITHQMPKSSELDPAYVEEAFLHMDRTGLTDGTSYCGATVKAFTYGC